MGANIYVYTFTHTQRQVCCHLLSLIPILHWWYTNTYLLVLPAGSSSTSPKALVTQLCRTPCDPMDCSPPLSYACGILCRQDYCSRLPFAAPGDLPDQGANLGLLYCRQILYHLSYRSPTILFFRFFSVGAIFKVFLNLLQHCFCFMLWLWP